MHSQAVTVVLKGLVDLLLALLDLIKSILELLEGKAEVSFGELPNFFGFGEGSSDLFLGGSCLLVVVTLDKELGGFLHSQVKNILILRETAPVQLVANYLFKDFLSVFLVGLGELRNCVPRGHANFPLDLIRDKGLVLSFVVLESAGGLFDRGPRVREKGDKLL